MLYISRLMFFSLFLFMWNVAERYQGVGGFGYVRIGGGGAIDWACITYREAIVHIEKRSVL